MNRDVPYGLSAFATFSVGALAFVLAWVAPLALYVLWGYERYDGANGGEAPGSYLLGFVGLLFGAIVVAGFAAATAGRIVSEWFQRRPDSSSRFVVAGVGSLVGVAAVGGVLYAAVVAAVAAVLAVAVIWGFFFVFLAAMAALARA